jgi:hypothetical protein
VRNYDVFTEDAAQSNQTYHHYLLALAQQEVLERDHKSTTPAAKLWPTAWDSEISEAPYG